jgi:hypothetical protein
MKRAVLKDFFAVAALQMPVDSPIWVQLVIAHTLSIMKFFVLFAGIIEHFIRVRSCPSLGGSFEVVEVASVIGAVVATLTDTFAALLRY